LILIYPHSLSEGTVEEIRLSILDQGFYMGDIQFAINPQTGAEKFTVRIEMCPVAYWDTFRAAKDHLDRLEEYLRRGGELRSLAALAMV
jgi:hypothetical protein